MCGLLWLCCLLLLLLNVFLSIISHLFKNKLEITLALVALVRVHVNVRICKSHMIVLPGHSRQFYSTNCHDVVVTENM